MTPSSGRRLRLLFLLALVVAGSLAHLRSRIGDTDPSAALEARGEGWTAVTADGSTLRVPEQRRDGIVLPAGAKIVLTEPERATYRVERLEFRVLRSLEETVAEVRLRSDESGGYELRLAPVNSYGVAWFHRSAGASLERIAARSDVPFVPPRAESFVVAIELRGPRFAVTIDGREALTIEDARRGDGAIELFARGGGLRVSSFAVAGQRGEAVFSWREDFAALAPPSRATSLLREIGAVLAWLGFLLLLSFVVLRPWSRNAESCADRKGLVLVLVVATPSALTAIVCSALSLQAPLSALAVSGILGIAAASILARKAPVLVEGGRPWRRLADTAFVAAVVLGYAAANREHRLLAPWREEATIAESLAAPEAFRSPGATMLDAGNALRVPGRSFRDQRLVATIRLAPRTLLEIRFHGKGPEGVALFVSADERVRTRFVRQTHDEFTTIGSGSDAIDPSRDRRLEVSVVGHAYRATIDGEEIARAEEHLFPSGETILLAARGEAIVANLSVEPAPSSPRPGTAAQFVVAESAFAATRHLAAIAGYALATMLLLRRSLRDGARLASLALLPLAGALLVVDRFGAERDLAIAVSIFAAGLGVVDAASCARRVSPLRFHGACLIAIALGTFAFVSSRERAWPTDTAHLNALSPLAWDGERIEDDLLDLEHPLLRRWNPYLVDHRMNGVAVTTRKPREVTRVIALGTSSTQGYGAEEDWPSLLGAELEREGKDGGRLELINAAWKGSNGQRLVHFLENVVVGFEPDVVLLSLYYNDSVGLTQFDETRYYREIGAPGARRGAFADFANRWRIMRGVERFRELEHRFDLGERDLTRAYRESGGPEPPPPERFRTTLAHIAELARSTPFRLILIHEPVAGDRPRIWKDEFRAAMNEVAREYDLTVVDPTPALLAAGGAKLFMDEVHPYGKGHAVTAKVLAPIVRDVIEEIRLDDGAGK